MKTKNRKTQAVIYLLHVNGIETQTYYYTCNILI